MSRRRSGRVGLALLGVVLGLYLGYLAVSGVRWDEVRNSLTGWPAWIVVAAVASVLLSSYLRGLRWSMLWSTPAVSGFRLMVVENAALGLNNLSPVRMFDEALELGILTLRDRLPGGQVIATMMMSRVQDLAFTLTFIALALLFIPRLWQYAPVLFGAVAFFGAWVLIILNFRVAVRLIPSLSSLPGATVFEGTMRALWRDPRRLARSFLLTASYWLLLAPAGMLLAHGAHIALPPHVVLVVVLGAIFFATSVPGLPGAVGTFEFAVVSLLSLWEVPREQALAFAVALHAVLYLPITAFAVVVLPREGLGSLRAIRELMESRRRDASRSQATRREESQDGGETPWRNPVPEARRLED